MVRNPWKDGEKMDQPGGKRTALTRGGPRCHLRQEKAKEFAIAVNSLGLGRNLGGNENQNGQETEGSVC